MQTISKETHIGVHIAAPDYHTHQASSRGGSVLSVEATASTERSKSFNGVYLLHNMRWDNGDSSAVMTLKSTPGLTPAMLRTLSEKLTEIADLLENAESPSI